MTRPACSACNDTGYVDYGPERLNCPMCDAWMTPEQRARMEAAAEAIHDAMGDQWHYSNWGTYSLYSDLPDNLKDKVRAAVRVVVPLEPVYTVAEIRKAFAECTEQHECYAFEGLFARLQQARGTKV